MKIKITEPYLWLPVDVKEEKVLLHLYSEGEKIDEIAIRVGWSMRMVSTICTISATLTGRNGKTCTGDMQSATI